MNIAVWSCQILLAIIFILHGVQMVSPPKPPIETNMKYILDLPPGFRRLLGTAEILAGIGLVLPALTGILPWLTPLAGASLVLLMVSGLVFHIRRKEYRDLPINLILLAAAAFVAYGRYFLGLR